MPATVRIEYLVDRLGVYFHLLDLLFHLRVLGACIAGALADFIFQSTNLRVDELHLGLELCFLGLRELPALAYFELVWDFKVLFDLIQRVALIC